MATYLIDYENVNKDGLNGVSKLTENDRVIIFYSSKADRMTFGLHRRLNETKATIEYKKVDVGGHNALDFQLATFLGFLISQDSSEEYCVVSNDRGFEFLVGFWRKPLYNVSLTREIATSPQAEERRQYKRHLQEEQHAAEAAQDHPAAEEEEQVYDSSETAVRVQETEENTQVLVVDQEGTSLPAAAPEQRTEIVEHGGENPVGRPFHMPSNRKYSYGNRSGNTSRPESSSRDGKADASRTSHKDSRAGSGAASAGKKRGGRGKNAAKTSEKKSRYFDDVRKLLADLDVSDSDCETVASYVDRYKTKLGINNALSRRFGTQKAGDIYRLIKPLISDKKGSDRQKTVSPEEEKTIKAVTECVSGLDLTEKERQEIASYVLKYKTKQGINNALVRKFGTQKAGSVYKLIKPLISNKKGPAQRSASGKTTEADKQAGEVKKLVSGLKLSDEDYKEIASFIQRYKTRQGVNNALVKRFRSQRAGEIYKLIKPLINDKKGGENGGQHTSNGAQ